MLPFHYSVPAFFSMCKCLLSSTKCHFTFVGNDRDIVTWTSHQDLLSSSRSYFKLNYCYSLLKHIKIFLVVVFSILFGRHSKVPYLHKSNCSLCRCSSTSSDISYSSWRLSIEVVLQHKYFLIAFCCLPCTESIIFVQRDHCYLVITFFLKLQMFNLMIQRIMEQYYVLIIFCSTIFFFSQFNQTVVLSHGFLHRWPMISLC